MRARSHTMVSIKEMKEVIQNAGLSVADLLERQDVEKRYAEALKTSKKKTKRLAKAVGRGATDGEDWFASPAAVTPTMIETPEELEQLIAKIGPEAFQQLASNMPGPPPGWRPGDPVPADAPDTAARGEIDRAIALASAGDCEGGIRVLAPVIERLDTEMESVAAPGLHQGGDVKMVSMRVNGDLTKALRYRARMYSNLREDDKAYADATKLVRYVPTLLAMGQHDRAADYLMQRAEVARFPGNYSSAIEDAKVVMDLGGKIDPETSAAALKMFQEASVMQLAKDVRAQPTRTRPHFPDEAARRAFQKRAQIGPFARKRLTGCEVCGKKEALMFCSGCQQVCYCSREHQKSHWKRHSADCKCYPDGRPHSLYSGTRAELLDRVRAEGFVLMGHPVNPDATLIDPETGEPYDLVSDLRVFCQDDRGRRYQQRLVP